MSVWRKMHEHSLGEPRKEDTIQPVTWKAHINMAGQIKELNIRIHILDKETKKLKKLYHECLDRST
jgi:hypothetical protein